MSSTIVISKKEARKLVLQCQGLLSSYSNSLSAIQQLSYVQIDTISVTARAHHHVFYTRNPNYNQQVIIQLMDDKKIFEYWSHAAAYLPIGDYRFSLFKKETYRTGNKHWFPRDEKVEKYVLDRIKAEGPLQSKDFDNPRNKNHEWYEWKPAKIALTNLFMDGSLMIANLKGFQKIFDIAENVLPANTLTTTPTLDEYCKHLIFNAIKAQGLVTLNEIVYLRKGIKTTVSKLLKQLTESKEIATVKVDSIDNIYYSTYPLLESIATIKVGKKVHLLNPFDNLVIQRKRLKELFDFEYLIECYVPEKKRIYGYYTLPILYGDKFVGRLDAKAERKANAFTVKHIWFEPEFKTTADFIKKIDEQLKLFANFCGCANLSIYKTTPSSYKEMLTHN